MDITTHFPGLVAIDASINSGGDKQILWAQTSTFSEMMQSCKCFPDVSELLTYNWVNNVVVKNIEIYA